MFGLEQAEFEIAKDDMLKVYSTLRTVFSGKFGKSSNGSVVTAQLGKI